MSHSLGRLRAEELHRARICLFQPPEMGLICCWASSAEQEDICLTVNPKNIFSKLDSASAVQRERQSRCLELHQVCVLVCKVEGYLTSVTGGKLCHWNICGTLLRSPTESANCKDSVHSDSFNIQVDECARV